MRGGTGAAYLGDGKGGKDEHEGQTQDHDVPQPALKEARRACLLGILQRRKHVNLAQGDLAWVSCSTRRKVICPYVEVAGFVAVDLASVEVAVIGAEQAAALQEVIGRHGGA